MRREGAINTARALAKTRREKAGDSEKGGGNNEGGRGDGAEGEAGLELADLPWKKRVSPLCYFYSI